MTRILAMLLGIVVLVTAGLAGWELAKSPDAGCTLERWLCFERFERFDADILEVAGGYGVDAAELKAAAWSGSGFRASYQRGERVRGLCAVTREEGMAWAQDRGVRTFLPVDLWDASVSLEVKAWLMKRDGRAGVFVGDGRFARYLRATGFGVLAGKPFGGTAPAGF
jgi:hypothetical protein